MTFIIVGVEVSCLLRFIPVTSNTSKFRDGGLILCIRSIRKNFTHREHTDIETDRQTEKAITDATLIPWITGLSGPIKPDNKRGAICIIA